MQRPGKGLGCGFSYGSSTRTSRYSFCIADNGEKADALEGIGFFVFQKVMGGESLKKTKKKDGLVPDHCPKCGATIVLRSAEGIYKENKNNTMLYICSNYPHCDMYVRTHPGTTKPVGTLADARLRKLRREAHFYFNQLYESGAMTDDDAYTLLMNIVQAPRSKAHIGYLGEYYCQQVIERSQGILRNHGFTPRHPARRQPHKGGRSA